MTASLLSFTHERRSISSCSSHHTMSHSPPLLIKDATLVWHSSSSLLLFSIMTRAIPIHPAYVDSVKARDAAPLLHQIKDFEEFNKAVDAHCATFKVPKVIEEDRKVEFNGKTLDLTLLRPLGTEKEVLPVIIFW